MRNSRSDVNNIEPTDNQLYELLWRDSGMACKVNGERIKPEPNWQFIDLMDNIAVVESFIRRVLSSKEVAFKFGVGDAEKDLKHLELAGSMRVARRIYIHFLNDLNPVYRTNFKYGEHVELFLTCCEANILDCNDLEFDPLHVIAGMGKRVFEVYNDFVESIRLKSKEPDFKNRAAQRKSNSTRDFKHAKAYVNQLFGRYRRLLVLRVDLSYQKEQGRSVTLLQALRDIKEFSNKVRMKKLYHGWVGFIRKLEYTHEKGFHFHMVIFYDGDIVRNDQYKAFQIVEYWQNTITKGDGLYYSCNANKQNYDKLGIGMIHRDHVDMRDVLVNKIIKYLCKPEQYIQFKAVDSKTKLLTMGQASK